MQLVVLIYLFSCGTFNITGIAVTGALSAVHRMMLDASRTCLDTTYMDVDGHAFLILHIEKRILYVFLKIKSSIDSFCCNIAWTHLYTLHTRALSELILCFDFRGP